MSLASSASANCSLLTQCREQLQLINKKMFNSSTVRVRHVSSVFPFVMSIVLYKAATQRSASSTVEGSVLYFAANLNSALCHQVIVVLICFNSPLSWKKKELLCIPENRVCRAVTCPQVKTSVWSMNLRNTPLL